jgi:hypothetical protein
MAVTWQRNGEINLLRPQMEEFRAQIESISFMSSNGDFSILITGAAFTESDTSADEFEAAQEQIG